MKSKLTYFFISGRKKRIFRSDKSFAKEFFYGYFHFVNLFSNVEIIEFEDRKSALSIVYKFLNKISNLPFYGTLVVNRQNYKVLKNSNNAIFTNQNTAFSALPLIILSKLRHGVKCHIFIMGLFGKKMNYKIQEIFRRLFIKVLISFSENLIFLGKGEYDLALKKFPDVSKKFKFIPFAVDVDFWSEKVFKNSTPEILFIGNDGMRDYDFLHKLTLNMSDVNFHIVSKNVGLYEFGNNATIYNGSWHSEELTDSFIKDLYHKVSLTILPIKETFQPSGQSVALQSMSCGTPVLITKTKGFWDKRKFVDSVNIFFQDNNELSEWENSIRNIIEKNGNLLKISRNCRELIVNDFNLYDFNLKLEKLIK